jgi:hypothetical protein
MKSSARLLAFWLGLFLFAAYLLSFSGKLHVMDEFVGFAAGNNLVQHGRADVNQFIWTNHWHTTPPGIWGKDGNLYTKKAPGISLAAAPLIWLGHAIPGLNAVHASLLTSAIATALTASLLVIWLVDLGLSRTLAGLTALGYGLGTIAWVYARLLWEHTIMALVFLLAVWAVYRAVHTPQTQHRWLWILLCGLAVAVSLTMRFEALIAVILFGAYFFLMSGPLSQGFSVRSLGLLILDRARWQALLIYIILPVLTVVGLIYFNFSRFGSISETGYNREILFQRPWEGAFGLLFSPSTGLFIYVPLTLLIFLGIRPAWRRLPHAYFWLIASLILIFWLFYGSWFSWGSTWVWGPRFLLHTLPLLMLFVAEALASLSRRSMGQRTNWRWVLVWLGVGFLALTGFILNFLGVVVDLNEHFLRLGRNDNFVFNWAAFPPLGHWRILQEGLVDLIWLTPQPDGFVLEWAVLGPALSLVGLTALGLVAVFISDRRTDPAPAYSPTHATPDTSRNLRRLGGLYQPVVTVGMVLLTVSLVYQLMLGTARLALANEQARADSLVLESLTRSTYSPEALFVPMVPFGDVQEISTYLMAYLDRPLPTYAWIESEPRGIEPDERDRLWHVLQAEADYVWLFERWLAQDAPLGATASRLNREAFPVQETWFEQSGRLTLYALPDPVQHPQTVAADVPFEGGLTLVDFTVYGDTFVPGDILRVRLTWQAGPVDQMAAKKLPDGRVVSFVHLLDQSTLGNVAQSDRLLLDLQNIEQSSLLPGQTITQGYGLPIPEHLSPGSYPLITGLYPAAAEYRLTRADNSPDDFLYLTSIVVR